MSESNWKEEAAHQSSQWLDTDEQESILELDATANQEYLEHVADLQLIDALLANMSEPAGTQKEVRIRAVMDAGFSVDDDFLTDSYRRWTKTKPLKEQQCILILLDMISLQPLG